MLIETIRRTWASVPVSNVDVLVYYGGDELVDAGSDLYLPVADDLRHVGEKTVAAFEHVLATREFDLVFRTNCSTYIDLTNLQAYVDRNAAGSGFYAGKGRSQDSIDFASGTGIFLSRDLVQLAVDRKDDWDHSYLDDVALGKLLHQFGVERQFAPVVVVRSVRDAKKADLSEFHFRCYTHAEGPRVDAEIMRAIHSRYEAGRDTAHPRAPKRNVSLGIARRVRANRVARALLRRTASAAGRLIVALATPRPGPSARRGPTHAGFAHSSETCLAVYTLVTDEKQYDEMLRSFAAAGLEPPLVEFVRLGELSDGSPSNPFAAITATGSNPPSRYWILCAQGVRLDQDAQGPGLLAALRELDDRDPGWVVAGTAGGTRELARATSLGDQGRSLPRPVVSLDDNFLVFNGLQSVRCSSSLTGFSFHGADVCLNARAHGGSAYVIDFPLSDVGLGRRGTDFATLRRLLDVWGSRRVLLCVNADADLVLTSRFRVLRRILGSPKAKTWVSACAREYRRRAGLELSPPPRDSISPSNPPSKLGAGRSGASQKAGLESRRLE
jgi:hypothetical protein